MSSTSDHDLAEMVRRYLGTGRFLLVMDDVWGVEDWNALRDVLPKSNRMATTREKFFFQEIKTQGVFEIEKCRRVCIHSNLSEFLSLGPKGPGIRSFLCFNKEPTLLDPKYTLAIPDGFKLLRVLESKPIKFHQFPKGITKLIHLRYITLSGDNLRVLPEAISELWNLQTIVVDTKSRQITVKANIWRMIQLRHLKTTAPIVLEIKGEGEGGENLQTLSRLSPEYCTNYVFNRARNIKTLGIFGKLASLVDANSLTKLHRLEKLKLVNDIIYESASQYRLNGLPQANCFPPNLKRLTLSATFLDWNHMSTLAKIGTLEALKLKENAFIGKFWNAVGDGFHSLHFLLIAETDLAYWEASTEYFPILRCLVLKNCGNLKRIPVGLAKSLQALDIERVCKSAVESARKIEEEIRWMQGRGKHERLRGGFKLSVGPGCE
ncbi:hypothetical protein DH2020_019200 [Rehmannia glutinosa]|uniref:Disease resistance protein n=1 Tax=Rehmannia glutinosa TaxID=99300 RepID=A0ABR0WL39_REHGL